MITESEKQRFVDNFHLIQASVGWTSEEFANRVGTTRQTINNVQNKKFKVSNILYAAMRYALEEEIRDNPEETEILKVILDAFVDCPNDYDKYPEATRKAMLEKARMLVPAIETKACDRKTISLEWTNAMINIAALTSVAIAAIVIGIWRKK